VSVDFAAEGLLEGLADERARRARLHLLEALHADGVSLLELRTAVAEDRLALLPVERVLAGDAEPRYTGREVAELVGQDLATLAAFRVALGFPIADPDERAFTEQDLETARRGARFAEAGLPEEGRLEVARAMGRAGAEVAEAIRRLATDALARPGDTELDLGLRLAEMARALAPDAGPALAASLDGHLREQVRQEVVGQADLASGRVRGTRVSSVAFADLVGFTRLGEQIPAEALGGIAVRLESLAREVARDPVKLVKTIGDAVMLVAPEPEPLVEALLDLVEAAGGEGEEFPRLRAGVACGEVVARAGDYYGRPVNLASRLTALARPASVLATGEVRTALGDRGGLRFSFAGERSFKGVKGSVPAFRVRRTAPESVR